MIEKLSVRNFKSWKNLQDMEFGKVTALFGANSSGKTSLIQLLLALKQTAESRDRRVFNLGGDERDYVDLGSYQDVIYQHDSQKDIEFKIVIFTDDEGGEETFSSQATIGYVNEQIVIKKLIHDYQPIHPQTQQRQVSIKEIVRLADGSYKVSRDGQDIDLDRPRPKAMSLYDGDAAGISSMVSAPLYDFVRSIFYLGPLRDYPRREYRWTGERPISVGVRGEYAVQALLANMLPSSSQKSKVPSQELVSSVNTWLQRLGLADRVELRQLGDGSRLYKMIIKSSGYKFEANIADVGFGVSQVLPIVVLAHFAPEGSLIILEQPEIHLHPNVQAELADLFLEVALKRNVQFLIESHSELLLQRLQKRKNEREGEFAGLTDKDVRLYFCRRKAEESVLEPVEVDAFGNIDNIPGEFYDPVTPFLEKLEADVQAKKIDLSQESESDFYITKQLSHTLREKDDEEPR